MGRYILIRLGQGIVVLLILLIFVFAAVRVTGDPLPYMLSEQASEADYSLLRSHLGLDKPLLVQFGIFLKHMATGDLGRSIYSRQPVIELLIQRVPNSVRLGILAMAFTLLLAFPFGVTAAVNRGRAVDILVRVLAALGQSLPQFWVGLVLMQIFAIKLRWLPVAEMGNFASYILPAFTLGVYVLASATRLLRSSMLDVLDCDFIREARVKGVSEVGVIWKHALRNALIPVVTFTGMYLSFFIMGSVVVETIFAWPGLGRLLIGAVMHRDFPVAQGAILLLSFALVVMNIAIDILYAYIDPRIRYKKV